MKNENYHNITKLLDSFAEGTISQADMLYLKSWVDESESHQEQARSQLRLQAALKAKAGEDDFDVEAAIRRFHAYVGDSASRAERLDGSRGNGRGARLLPIWLWGVAVAALVLIIVLPLVAYRAGSDSVRDAFAEIQLESPAGERFKIMLPDGTRVMLNSASTISYSQGFGITDRTVHLKGEAFFDVKHDSRLPFTVKTRELDVNDIGTAFLFTNYDDESVAKVELYRGKVSLDSKISNASGVELVPSQCAVINKKTGALTTRQLQSTEEEAKSQDLLSFVNMPLSDIVKVLSRAYGQPVVATGKVGRLKFYGRFSRHKDSITEVLESIAGTGKIHYKKENGTYILYQ